MSWQKQKGILGTLQHHATRRSMFFLHWHDIIYATLSAQCMVTAAKQGRDIDPDPILLKKKKNTAFTGVNWAPQSSSAMAPAALIPTPQHGESDVSGLTKDPNILVNEKLQFYDERGYICET